MADQRYLVTARKYRPSLFREVVAQQHVTDTLKNALRLDRLAHAYLFSGPRGVGKTTTARILAKAINCETPREEREDEAEPCCECDSCLSFEAGRSLNVFEMDAASNNKVDDIRELRETVRIPPQGSTKKVYILDEVHMLSKSAFNALLKTLEEPPPHALFIFATTEPHKVLPTILSRCQRFDFRRIPVPKVVSHLRTICEEEDIEADEESLMLLARKGEGALRDALSAFDQAISLCGTTLEYGDLTQALGVVDQELYFTLTDHVAAQDTAGVLKLVHHVVRSGHDLQEFLGGLAEHLRNLLVARSLDGEALEDVAESTRARYAKDAQRFREADLLRLLTIAGDAENEVKTSSQPRLKLEMTLLKMVKMRRSVDLKAVLRKISRLEQMVESGDLPETLPPSAAPSNADTEATTEPASDPAPTVQDPPTGYDTDTSASSETPSQAPASEEPASPEPGSEKPASAEPPATEPTATEPVSTEPSSPEPESEPEADAPEPPFMDDASSAGDASTAPDMFGTPSDSSSKPTEPETADTETADAETASPEADDAPAGDAPSSDENSDDPDDRPSGGSSGRGGNGGGGSGDGDIGYPSLFDSPALSNRKKKTRSDDDSASPDARGASQGDGQSADGPSAQATLVAEPTPDTTADLADSHGMDAIEAQWSAFVQRVMKDRIRLGALLSDTAPESMKRGRLTIGVPKALHRDALRDDHRTLLEHLTATVDVEVDELAFRVREAETEAPAASGTEDDALISPRDRLEELRGTYDALNVLFDDFGAELVW